MCKYVKNISIFEYIKWHITKLQVDVTYYYSIIIIPIINYVYMKNKIEYLNVSLALTLLSLALLHVQSSSYPLESIIHVAKAA